ncbi:unnamed protein product [Parascedosporium putredinis]|uniref:LrgB-like protein n=1 Tax=Parascedosporium putredinis TaxID=1442378 RepID=A0A9P1H8T7_9PEZI|nr:unnamed protein product [Parascedosporium putredinis]CAI8000155.1 unnamed protein product [Parascedosporium putredinis]
MAEMAPPLPPYRRLFGFLRSLPSRLRHLSRGPGPVPAAATQTLPARLLQYFMLERQPKLGKKTKVILTYFLRKAAFLVSVVALYLVCHLAIWGLSVGLEKVSLNYCAPLIAMIFVLFCSSMIQLAWAPFDHYYQGFIQSRSHWSRVLISLALVVFLRLPWRNAQWCPEGQPESAVPLDTAASDAGASAPVVSETNDQRLQVFLQQWGGAILSALVLLLIGIPMATLAQDERVLDACSLCLAWTLAIAAQQRLKSLRLATIPPAYVSVIATIVNPVLVTAGITAGYVRLKAQASGTDLSKVLTTFCGGTTLAKLLIRWTTRASYEDDAISPFGAGDLALSLLECGIVVWGFKLYECRQQLFSRVGAVVALLSGVLAGLCAIISVVLARAVGLAPHVALAFTARSSTLALAKPSTASLGGDLAVNAGVVVGNGILGQLIAPLLIAKFRIPDHPVEDQSRVMDGSGSGSNEPEIDDDDDDGNESARASADKMSGTHEVQRDSALDVAVGAAIGVNGAAMGVAYLYDRRSRVAPTLRSP